MRPAIWESAFDRISQGLHQGHDDIVNEPLPERWIELIKRLNAEEDQTRASTGPPYTNVQRS